MPEDSIEAFTAAVDGGAHGIEFDVRMLADGTLAVCHDDTVDRIMTTTGAVNRFTAASWRRLAIDAAGLLPGGGWTTATPVAVDDLLRAFGNRVVLAPQVIGDSFNGNAAVASALMDALARNNIDKTTVLIQTGQADTVAQVRAEGYACAKLDGTVTAAIDSGAEFWGVNQATVSDADITTAVTAGVKVLPYTVNDQYTRDRLLALGATGFYSDDPIYIAGTRTERDLFVGQTWVPGLRSNNGDRGKFYTPDAWGYDINGSASTFALHGAMRPSDPQGWTLDFSMRIDAINGGDVSRGGSLFLGTTDRPYYDQSGATGEGLQGYYFLMRANGQAAIGKYDNTTDTKVSLGTGTLGVAPVLGAVTSYRITVTATTVKIERTDVTGTPLTVTDSFVRPSFLSLGRFGAGVRYSGLIIDA